MRPAPTSFLGLVLVLAASAGCSRLSGSSRPEASPESVVRAWLEAVDDAPGSEAAALRSFALLSEAARANLDERSRRTNVLFGRRTRADEMIVHGMSGLRFRPSRFETRAEGATAQVVVSGNENERAVFSCVREGDGWHVDLALPPLPAQIRH
ncbi:MAG: hypothetical protein U0169_23940 [Polyangiaceae bacterium]